MSAKNLRNIFQRLSLCSIDSVENGDRLGDLSEYLHVSRPIEKQLDEKLKEVEAVGGGIILLIGSAGDGKSHLISCIKKNNPNTDFIFYNDATVSRSPNLSAVQTLKEALQDFNDNNLHKTNKKLVLAINLGKLNAFIDDEDVKKSYTNLVNKIEPIFKNNTLKDPEETDRIKIVLFPHHQIFEIHTDDENDDYPVDSIFLMNILNKITAPIDQNPFYKAFIADKNEKQNEKDPLIINYEFLQIKQVRQNIVKYIIEAIIRYKLMLTPREYLDFIYNILCYPLKDAYKERKDFYNALLPNLFFCGGDNHIQKKIALLDPLKYSSTKHDSFLSLLFTSSSIPEALFEKEIQNKLPKYMINRTNKFYSNNGKDIELTTQFLLRVHHLLSYHSESQIYKQYLNTLKGVFNEDLDIMSEIYNWVNISIPRHYGSYYGKTGMIPLNIQGGKYKLFSYLNMRSNPIKAFRKENSPNEFLISFLLEWECNNKKIKLPINYQLYEYIYKLKEGRLAMSYENDKDICFSRFIRELSELCDNNDKITVLTTDNKELSLFESLGRIQLQS